MQLELSVEQILKRTPLLAHLSDVSLAELSQAMETEQLAADEVLFHQDDFGTDMYIVQSGSVKVVLDDAHGRELLLNEYGPGRLFGELSLLSRDPRSATVIATSPTTLLKLTRETFTRYVSNEAGISGKSVDEVASYLRERYKLATLKKIDWFAALSTSDLEAIAQDLKTETFEQNDILFERGDEGDMLYIVVRGWVSVHVNSQDGDVIVLNQFGPGDIFGEMALVDNKPRSASARALAPLEVMTLRRDKFLNVITNYPPIALETLRSLSSKLRFAATYLERTVEWSQRIADGDYSMVLDQIEATHDTVYGEYENDDSRVQALLSAFFKMVQGVQKREDELRDEISALKLIINVDDRKREEQVREITETPFFESLKSQVRKLRAGLEEDAADES